MMNKRALFGSIVVGLVIVVLLVAAFLYFTKGSLSFKTGNVAINLDYEEDVDTEGVDKPTIEEIIEEDEEAKNESEENETVESEEILGGDDE